MPQQVSKSWTLGKISTLVGVITGIITILIFVGSVFTHINEWVVTPNELKLSEQRIIKKIEAEAVKTRTVYITEMIERKAKLEAQLETEVNPGKIESLAKQIDTLDQRIEKLRGK